MSVGEVSRTQVVCRSAPASRTGSPVHSDSRFVEGRREKRTQARKDREPMRRGRRGEKNRLPSLARTNAEGDIWIKKRDKPSTAGGGNRYLSGWGMDPNSDDDGGDQGKSSSEDDGELNLAQMLVPPKRQNSIKSLRKHLDSSMSAGMINSTSRARGPLIGAERRSAGGQQTILEDGWDGSDTEQLVGKGYRRKNSGEGDEDEEYPAFLADGRGLELKRGVMGSGRSATGKRRVGLPAPWGLSGGGS
jgi:hypothetical protein